MQEAELAPVAKLFPPQGKWAEFNYFALPDTNRYIELSEGRIIMPPHPTRSHQMVVEELYVCLRTFVRERNLGEVHIAPLPVRLWPGKIREPDIFFLSKKHSARAGEQIYGIPDLVIEVLSPGTEQTDRGEKFIEYAKAGVIEYWIVDSAKQRVEVYTLKGGVYELNERYSLGAKVCSHLLPELEIEVEIIFRQE
jgi:Uma2 family endonuclease